MINPKLSFLQKSNYIFNSHTSFALDPKKGQIKKETKKTNRVQISFQSDASTLKLLNELVWLKQYAIDMEAVSQDDIVRQGIELLAKKINYDKLRKEHAKKLDNYKPSAGRKKKA